MASYSMEDIELIRRKSGISYEEAVSLLDYHNGEVARVLIDLERNGRLKEKADKPQGTVRTSSNSKGSFMNFIQKLYRTRVKVRKGDTVIVNLSVLFMVLAVILFSPHLAVLSLILSLILGYRFSIDTNDEAFRADDLKELVSNAAGNVKRTVGDISREISEAARKVEEKKAEKKGAETPAEAKKETESTAQPMSTTVPDPFGSIVRDLKNHDQGPDVPVIQMPVRVESTDGDIEVTSGNDGYHTATIG